MQDRFKFRTYIPDLKFFKYWGWIDKNHYIGLCASGDTSMPELLEKYTEQCTGLKDKNGKLIYEGDVVKFRYSNNKDYIGSIKYTDEDALFCLNYINENNRQDWDYVNKYKLEVIGNIYETPELLESEVEK